MKNYVSNLLTKLGMERRTEAAVYAARQQERGGRAPPRSALRTDVRLVDDRGLWRPPPPATIIVSVNDSTDQDWSGLEILSDEQCLARLRSSTVGRVGFVDAGSPSILPVNYALDGRAIVFRSAPGSKLSAGMMQRPVAFEIDAWNAVDHLGWSVLAKGIADEVLDGEEIARLEQLPVRPWSRPGSARPLGADHDRGALRTRGHPPRRRPRRLTTSLEVPPAT